jgi:hypothetical protein
VSQVNAIYNFYVADAALQHDIGQNDPDYVPNVPHVKQPGPTHKNGGATTGSGGTKITSAAPVPSATADASEGPSGASGGRKP